MNVSTEVMHRIFDTKCKKFDLNVSLSTSNGRQTERPLKYIS